MLCRIFSGVMSHIQLERIIPLLIFSFFFCFALYGNPLGGNREAFAFEAGYDVRHGTVDHSVARAAHHSAWHGTARNGTEKNGAALRGQGQDMAGRDEMR